MSALLAGECPHVADRRGPVGGAEAEQSNRRPNWPPSTELLLGARRSEDRPRSPRDFSIITPVRRISESIGFPPASASDLDLAAR